MIFLDFIGTAGLQARLKIHERAWRPAVRMAVVVLAFAALPVRAQVLTPDHHACANDKGDVEAAAQQKACTALIARGGDKANLAVAYANRGNSFLRRGDNDKAIADYGQAITLDPKLVDAYRNRGAAYFNLGTYDKALTDYDAAIRLDPREAGGYADRCSVRVMTGNMAEAKADCDKAVDLDAQHVDARAWRTLVHLQLGQLTDADADIEAILSDNLNDPAVRYLKGMVLEALGEKAEADGQFQAARELDAEEFGRLDKLYGRFRKR